MPHDSSLVQEWLQIHRELLDFETAFTDLAIRAARGELAPGELDSERARLMAMRQTCTAAYERAFPQAQGAAPGGRA